MWSISTLVTPKGDDQMADIQAERIQPPHRRCVVVKKPTVDFQNFLTTEKYFEGVTDIYQMFKLHASFLVKINRTESLPILEFLMKSEVVTFQDLWSPFQTVFFNLFF